MSDPGGKWARTALADLEHGLKAFGPVTPRHVKQSQPLPFRGVGTKPDGRVTLAVTDRWIFVKDLFRDPTPDALGATFLDSITLSAQQWKGLAPSDPKAGSKWTVPEATARKFFPLLSATDTVFRDTGEVTSVRLAGRVEKLEGGIAYLSYEGHIAATHQGTKNEARAGQHCSSAAELLGGVGVYDVKASRLLSLTLVFAGQFRNYAPYDSPAPFGAVVEWSDKPMKR